jgi:hypothetical protein
MAGIKPVKNGGACIAKMHKTGWTGRKAGNNSVHRISLPFYQKDLAFESISHLTKTHYSAKVLLRNHYSITPIFHYSIRGEAPKFLVDSSI